MPTPMQNAVDTLWLGQRRAAGVSVLYRQQGAPDVVATLTMVPGGTATEVVTNDGSVMTERTSDFIVDVASWEAAFSGNPEIGDQITHETRIYEVLAPVGGRHFREIGRHKQLYRIHTKEVA